MIGAVPHAAYINSAINPRPWCVICDWSLRCYEKDGTTLRLWCQTIFRYILFDMAKPLCLECHMQKSNDPTTEEFRQEVRDALAALKTSPRKLSQFAGLGENYINQMFRGVSPTLEQVGKIRAAIRDFGGGSDVAK